jgi:hypothetical protein
MKVQSGREFLFTFPEWSSEKELILLLNMQIMGLAKDAI